MKSISEALEVTKTVERPKNNTTEFQMFGVYLADQLEDPKHYSLYIRLAKKTDRAILQEALTYTKGYTTAKSKAKVFMWRLKQLSNPGKTS